MSDWDIESSIVSGKKRGVIPQRERNLPDKKNKKSAKHWVVYRLWKWSWSSKPNTKNISEYSFAKEEDAIRYAERIRRRWLGFDSLPADEVWVANNERLQEWKKEIVKQRSNSSKT